MNESINNAMSSCMFGKGFDVLVLIKLLLFCSIQFDRFLAISIQFYNDLMH